MSKKVTIAVSVYNIERYLSTCVDSVLAQTYDNIEVILVDDGSTDQSGAICDEYARKSDCIRVIHKENGGLSSARNAAIQTANGDYILFLDGDDWISSEMLEIMAHKAEEYDADVVTVNMCSFDDETGETLKESVMPDMKDIVLDFSSAFFDEILPMFGKQFSIFGANNLYRAATIKTHDLFFEPTQKVHSEDQLFNFCFYAVMHRAAFISLPMYHYRIRSSSLSHAKKPADILNRRLTMIRCLKDFLTKQEYPRQRESAYAALSWAFFMDGCFALGNSAQVTKGLNAIDRDNRMQYRKMLWYKLIGATDRSKFHSKKSFRAALYEKAMVLLLLFGRNQRPVETYLSPSR